MTNLFFYGTLCHLPLLECVLGRPRANLHIADARLVGHAVCSVAGETFPAITARPGAIAWGIVVRDLSDEDVARLRYYEGGFDYGQTPLQVETAEGMVTAQVFFPEPGRWALTGAWHLADWQRAHAPMVMAAAEEIMAWYGRKLAEDIAARYTPINIRAHARVLAGQRTPDPDRDLTRDVVVQARRHAYMNFFSLREVDLQFRQHDGSLGPVLNRGALFVGEAVVVLPYDPVRDCVLLVEQFRAPVFMAGDPAPWVWEPVAGLIDPGETPEQAARREAQEEAGLTLDRLLPAGRMYSSTGSSSEFLNLFIGLADLGGHHPQDGGLAEEGEDIRSRLVSFDKLIEGVDNDRWRDMPLVTTALWLARHRDRLRQA
ncbi:NUDIX domain-containing protein [Arenibacterium halophilum]|uniref:ADP-ribose pyrophosphatase n=1 Tax=Arenibacterium halophilum TaxID=2583821 RepID=A0ABY2X9P8_9RHOB|nr:NUDIX domain-containing protein [Arenibacterium halophilum]TMV13076.1 NUDIX domain-containing protein [Arenibacterium halophilum]